MKTDLSEKLRILAESAKYDVSCSSGGVRRRGTDGAPGSTGSWGVCHSFTEDGRCVSLFKIMLTNYCIYDCAYLSTGVATTGRVRCFLRRSWSD